MDRLAIYPKKCRRNMKKIIDMLCIDDIRAYGMLKLTAEIMELDMDDRRVVRAILDDCGIEDGE